MPRASAQVTPYVECLGPELAVQFLLKFGGAGFYLGRKSRDGNIVAELVGSDAVARMAEHPQIGPYVARVPIAGRWLALMLHWQGHSINEIARMLRSTDVTVRRYLADGRSA